VFVQVVVDGVCNTGYDDVRARSRDKVAIVASCAACLQVHFVYLWELELRTTLGPRGHRLPSTGRPSR
jgi:hypothetical protein